MGDIDNDTCREDEIDECGIAYDHNWRPGDVECRNCGADLSEWNRDDDAQDHYREWNAAGDAW